MKRESDLYIPVRDWLREHGHEVHVEVFGCDVVAVRGSELTVVELKLSSPALLVSQLHQRSQWADFVLGAMPHRPKSTGMWKHWGFGLLIVSEGKVRQLIRPRRQPDQWYRKHGYRIKRLAGRQPAQAHETAGLPCCPQLREQRVRRSQEGGS